jgi:hypothetical protein
VSELFTVPNLIAVLGIYVLLIMLEVGAKRRR